MNIFYLDRDPKIAAQYHYDKHVVKMILESAQLLSTAHRIIDGEQYIELNKAGARMRRWRLGDDREQILYKSTHFNHPSAIWARANNENYEWLYWLYRYLLEEYTYRYGKHHASERLIIPLAQIPNNITDDKFFDVTPAMDKELIIPGDSIASYRNYYKTNKEHLRKYTKREEPYWLIKGE